MFVPTHDLPQAKFSVFWNERERTPKIRPNQWWVRRKYISHCGRIILRLKSLRRETVRKGSRRNCQGSGRRSISELAYPNWLGRSPRKLSNRTHVRAAERVRTLCALELHLRLGQFSRLWSYSYLSVELQLGGCHCIKAVVVMRFETQPKIAVSISRPLRVTLELIARTIELVPGAGFFTLRLIFLGIRSRGSLIPLGISPVGLYAW